MFVIASIWLPWSSSFSNDTLVKPEEKIATPGVLLKPIYINGFKEVS